MRVYHSIFNDVLGPIMNGPSSSHSAGCCRIGLATRCLYGKEVTQAKIIFDKNGSYPSTYIGQGSDFGFTGGLLGLNTDDSRLKDSVSIAKRIKRNIVFEIADLGSQHPNQAEILLLNDKGTVEMSVMTFSIGGGMFEIRKLDEFDVMIDGTQYQYFLCFDIANEGELRKEVVNFRSSYSFQKNNETGRLLICINTDYDCVVEISKQFGSLNGLYYIRCIEPVVPNIKNEESQPPFFNAKEAKLYAKVFKREIWQLCEDYEMGYGFITKEDSSSLITKIYSIMQQSTVPIQSDTAVIYGFLPYQAAKMTNLITNTKVIDAGLLNRAMLSAIAVLENSCAHNIVVAAPTAGSSGVIPAALISVGSDMRCSDDDIKRAIMTAGVVGVFIANQATFGAEEAACQAEMGSAASMAAAGVVQLLGGTLEQCFAAASMALQNMLGLICDPVAGLTEIPCVSRNVAAVANAIMSANMAVLGFDPVIPFDEVILTMKDVGNALPAELRCTCKGGLCTTATGNKIANQMKNKWNE